MNRTNYRQVSLTSVVCKLLEGFVRDVMTNNLIKNKLLAKKQHGFVPNKSCISNLLETLEYITGNLSDGHNVDEILLDLSKAFGLVPHRRLVYKLKKYGLDDEIALCFEDFLKNRKQRIVLGHSVSGWKSILSGVPQGSVLEPILFVIYINDLPELVSNRMKLYADGSKIITTINDWIDSNHLQKDFDKVTN